MADSDVDGEFAGGEYYALVAADGRFSGTYEDAFAMSLGGWSAARR